MFPSVKTSAHKTETKVAVIPWLILRTTLVMISTLFKILLITTLVGETVYGSPNLRKLETSSEEAETSSDVTDRNCVEVTLVGTGGK